MMDNDEGWMMNQTSYNSPFRSLLDTHNLFLSHFPLKRDEKSCVDGYQEVPLFADTFDTFSQNS